MKDHLQLRSIIERDSRYKLEAYYYVLETLDFARSQLGMGHCEPAAVSFSSGDEELDEPENVVLHISGGELCEAIRIRALGMFGLMAKTVFQQWGITTTDDFGEIVYNMVEAGKIQAASNDCREAFHQLYDFQKVFCDDFSFHEDWNSLLHAA